MRVLQMVSCLELGGTEAFIMNHYRAMDRTECQFDFLVFVEKDYPYLEEIQRLGGRVFFSGPPALRQVPAFLKNACRIIRENGPYDAVHSHVNFTNGWTLLAAKLCGVPVRISHSHDTDGRDGGWFKRRYADLQVLLIKACATRTLACGEAAGEYLYGKEWFRRRGGCVHNSIDVGRFLPRDGQALSALRREFAIPEDCGLVLGNITRFEPKKNPLFGLRVFAELLRLRPDAVFLMGGPDGGQLEDAKRLAEALGIGDRVRFIGPRRDIPDCLKLIDVYLFPSLFEGLPIGLLEAQAAGCGCLVADTVDAAVDMGAGTVRFLSLEAPPQVWAETALALAERARPEPEELRAAFARSGYELAVTARRLLALFQALCP